MWSGYGRRVQAVKLARWHESVLTSALPPAGELQTQAQARVAPKIARCGATKTARPLNTPCERPAPGFGQIVGRPRLNYHSLLVGWSGAGPSLSSITGRVRRWQDQVMYTPFPRPAGNRLRRGHLGEQRITGLFAAPARFGADAAMFHAMLAMLCALVAAQRAGLSARLKERPNHGGLERSLTRQDAPGSGADVGAVQIQANAPGQMLDLSLAEAGVGAGGAGLRAVEARANALGQRAAIHRWFLRS